MLNPDSPVPLYRQLADELEAQIRAGQYGVGARIPSEHQLAAHYRLGRPTVRQATELLVRRGRLQRRRGAGTYVAEPRPEVDLFTLAGTLAAFERTGLQLRTRLLDRPQLRPIENPPAPSQGERRFYGFTRLGTLGRVPVLVEQLFLDPDVFPRLDQLPLGQASLSRLVEEHYHLRPIAGRQTFRVGPAPARFSAALRIGATAPVLCIRRWLDFPGAPAALFARMYCRTDQVELVQSLSSEGACAQADRPEDGEPGANLRPERLRRKSKRRQSVRQS